MNVGLGFPSLPKMVKRERIRVQLLCWILKLTTNRQWAAAQRTQKVALGRLGCGNCKRRRVKCDEIRPTCTNCSQHSIECDYSTTQTPKPNQNYRFKQSKFQSLTGSPNETSRSISTQCDLSASHNPSGISFVDLHLFHHFTTSTYKTLTDGDDSEHTWDIHVPQWGISFPSILHLILALSALHLGYQQPHLRDQYVMQADDHFTFGIRSVRTVLSDLDSENCQLIYISAVLVCYVYFAHGPKSGEYLVFSETGQAEWLILMHGVRSILQSKHDEIFTGILTPKTDDGAPQHINPSLQEEFLQHQTHIRKVKEFIEAQTADHPGQEMYISAIDALLGIFEDTYKKRSVGKDGAGLMHLVIGWIYRLPEQFFKFLELKDPFAFMILAYWNILLKYMDSSWFMAGWDKHVISGICGSLHGDFHKWIEWPVNCIQHDVQVNSFQR